MPTLNHKQARLDTAELSPRNVEEREGGDEPAREPVGEDSLVVYLGQDDFAALRKRMAKRWGAVRLGDFIQSIRCVFNYGYDAELLEGPCDSGRRSPDRRRTLRLELARKGPKLFEAEELRRILGVSYGRSAGGLPA